MRILTSNELRQISTQTPSGIWIVDKTLRTDRKRISLLCGSPEAGKSTLARQLALAVAHGEQFLGRDALKSKVVYWQSEETEEDAAEDFRKSGLLDEDNVIVLQPEAGDNNHIELNKVLVNDPDIRLVIVETLDDFLQMDDLSDNPTARKAFEKFDKEIVHEHVHRCVFLALHHFKKSDEQRGATLAQILGATVIAGKTDCKIFMRENGGSDHRRVVSIRVRKGTKLEPTYLDFDEATSTSTLGQTVADEQAESKKVSVVATNSELRTRTIEIISNNPGITKTECYAKVGGYKRAAEKMVDSLIGEGLIDTRKGGQIGTAIILYIKGKAPSGKPEPPRIPYEDLPMCGGCGCNKVAGEDFNAVWGAKYCSAVCQTMEREMVQ